MLRKFFEMYPVKHWERLLLGKIEGKKRTRPLRMRWLDVIIDSTDMSSSKLWEAMKDRQPVMLQSMGPQIVGHD